MNIIIGLAGIVIKELYRRKDFYVLFVMTAVITLVMGSVTFFNDAKIARYLKELCLALIWLSALVIAIGTTARQIPMERENRTIFPLLAKPVTRWHVIMGKFTGCWLACGIALVVFYLFFGVVSGSREHQWPVLIFLQGLWLQWAMLAIVIALCLLGSVLFTAPSSNATITFVIVLSILLIGRHLNKVALQQPEPVSSMLSAIYYMIPHLEWYDVRDFIIYNNGSVGFMDCVLATIYAAVYTGLLLMGAWLAFRRKALNT
jgi:ABC-type transport system involved in multi-copper enzyme maturation permease subunit